MNAGHLPPRAGYPLPRAVEALTPEWLTEAMSQRCPGITVASVTVDGIIWGTATKILVDVSYVGDAAALGMPNKLCIKGEFDERVRKTLAAMTMTGTQVEALFYNDLGPELGVPLPRHWFGGSEPGMGILILDNLSAVNATFGAPTQPWRPELVGRALDILATVHGSTWDKSFADVDWLPVGPTAIRQANEYLMSDAHWSSHFGNPEVFQLPLGLKDRERCLAGLHAMWRYDDAHAFSLIHGDAHLGNTCIDAEGRPFFIDWAGPCRSCWAFDVANFMVGALTVPDRRASEQELLRGYLTGLAAHGGPVIPWSEAWDDYRRHILNGLIWPTVPPTMQPLENVRAMGERYTTALLDHDTLGLLGV
jgi:hypothetical protein